jgi:hypothetical protein
MNQNPNRSTQNRIIAALVVVLLFALAFFIIWTVSPAPAPTPAPSPSTPGAEACAQVTYTANATGRFNGTCTLLLSRHCAIRVLSIVCAGVLLNNSDAILFPNGTIAEADLPAFFTSAGQSYQQNNCFMQMPNTSDVEAGARLLWFPDGSGLAATDAVYDMSADMNDAGKFGPTWMDYTSYIDAFFTGSPFLFTCDMVWQVDSTAVAGAGLSAAAHYPPRYGSAEEYMHRGTLGRGLREIWDHTRRR